MTHEVQTCGEWPTVLFHCICRFSFGFVFEIVGEFQCSDWRGDPRLWEYNQPIADLPTPARGRPLASDYLHHGQSDRLPSMRAPSHRVLPLREELTQVPLVGEALFRRFAALPKCVFISHCRYWFVFGFWFASIIAQIPRLSSAK